MDNQPVCGWRRYLGFNALRIQRHSYTALGYVDFGNGQPGLYVLKGNAALTGTALDPTIFGSILLPDNHKSPPGSGYSANILYRCPKPGALPIGNREGSRQSIISRQTIHQQLFTDTW